LLEKMRIAIKGGGDLGTGIAWRLNRSQFRIVVIDVEQPTAIRRTVAFASAVYDGCITIEGVLGRIYHHPSEIAKAWQAEEVPVLVDGQGDFIKMIRPDVLIDAMVAKKNMGTSIYDAPLVIALGPGFIAGVDCHCVIETNRGHNLGRVIRHGCAEEDTGVPGVVAGESSRRVILSPSNGFFSTEVEIGTYVNEGQVVAYVDKLPVLAKLSGVVRGLLHSGLTVFPGMKVGDIDPRARYEHCFMISDKALAVAGGVLEAILSSRFA
jgi:xanthine dehydrogenase accessory factor